MNRVLYAALCIVVVTVAAICWFGIWKADPLSLITPETTSLSMMRAEATPHPVSIEALRQRSYDGSDFTIGPIISRNEAYAQYFITYKSEGLTISGIMNLPHGGGPFPVLFLNHGYIDTDIYTNGRGLRREQDYLARRGYVVIHSDYRNHAESDPYENVELELRFPYAVDVINAIYAVHRADLPFIDKTKMGMLGHSMGGGIAINIMAAKPELIKAYVLFAPVSSDQGQNYYRWTDQRPAIAAKVLELFGLPEENQAFWAQASAENFFDRLKSPVLIHHGTADADVPIVWSVELHENLKSLGKDSTLHIYTDEPHEFIDAWPMVMSRTVDFFDRYVKGL